MVGRLGRLWYEHRVVVVVVVIVLLAAAGLVIASVFSGEDKEASAVDNALVQAQRQTTKGDYDEAYSKLKDVENEAVSKTEKVTLYSELSAAAGNAGKLDEAISYLEKRHQLDASTINLDAEVLGGYYERKGDTAAALQQYKLALAYYESLPQGDIGTQVTVTGLKGRIAELEGVQQ